MLLQSVRPTRGHLVTLAFDDGSEACIDKTVWEESPFGVGSSLSAVQLEALCEHSSRRRAENKAVFLLSKRDLSRRELEQKLCRERGRYTPDNREAAAAAAARMEELGYVNDDAYARRLAEQFVRVKLYPPRRVTEELCRRGIARDTVREVVAELSCDELQLALAFLHKKRYTVPKDTKEAARIAGALARYGYSADTVRRAMTQWANEDFSDE